MSTSNGKSCRDLREWRLPLAFSRGMEYTIPNRQSRSACVQVPAGRGVVRRTKSREACSAPSASRCRMAESRPLGFLCAAYPFWVLPN